MPRTIYRKGIDWNEIIPVLGIHRDKTIAKKFNISREMVGIKRRELNIPYNRLIPVVKPCKTNWAEAIPFFGKITDGEIAIKLGVRRESVSHTRKKLGFEKLKQVHSCETRKKMSKSHMGKQHSLGTKHSVERIKQQSEIAKRYFQNNPKAREKSAIRMKNCENRCKKYLTPIGFVKGTYELRYVNELIKNNLPLPTIPKKGLTTDWGLYFPDFEFADRYIEIKSSYTFDVSIGKKGFGNGAPSSKQMQKINYVRDFIKPVQVIVLNPK